MELRQYVMIVWKRWWLILLTTALAAAAALAVSFLSTPMYRATTTLEIKSGADPGQAASTAIRDAEAIAGTYVLQLTSPTIAEAVIARLQLAFPVEDVQKMLSASRVGTSSMININAENANPALAQALASTTADVFIEQQTTQQQARYQASLTELEAQIAALEAEIMGTRAAVANLGDAESLAPAARAELARLETELSNNQTRLSIMLNSTEQFRLEMAKGGDYILVFSPAKLPTEPFAPQPLRNTALALVVGGMIGVGIAFLLDYLDDTLHDPQEAQSLLGVNTLAAIPQLSPKSDEDDEQRMIVIEEPLHPVSEAFRNLRTSVRYANLDHDISTLMVTSSLPSEGKSFVAANLAATLACDGRKVVLVEADLRRPTVHKFTGHASSPGLSEALLMLSDEGPGVLGTDPFLDLLQPIEELPGLMLALHSGDKVPDPAELLGSSVFERLLGWLKSYADVVVIDTPPVLSVADAAVVSTLVDAVLVVTAAGETRISAVAQTLERLQAVGARTMGLIINRMSPKAGGYYGYYYYSGYAYYNSAEEEGQSKGRLPWQRKDARRRTADRRQRSNRPQDAGPSCAAD